MPATKPADVDCTYALATFEIHSNQLRLKKVICDGLDDKTSALFYWKRPPKVDGTQMVLNLKLEIILLLFVELVGRCYSRGLYFVSKYAS